MAVLVSIFSQYARERDVAALRDLAEEIPALQPWLTRDHFDRRKVNRRLRQYAIGDAEWRWPDGGTE